MSETKFIQLTTDELKQVIAEAVNEGIALFLKQQKNIGKEEYLTRKEVKEILNIEYTTISRWTKEGRLKAYGIGSRVYYKRSEIDNCLIPLNN